MTPEYNHSIPGALKNLLDHLYPEYGDTVRLHHRFRRWIGGIQALSHFHDITLALNAHPGPDLPVSNVTAVFDEDGTLINDTYDDRFRGIR